VNPHPDAPAVLQFYEGHFTWLVIECPFCGRRHVHGGGLIGDDPREFLSWRSPHCMYPPKDAGNYQLVDLDPRRTERTIATALHRAKEKNERRRALQS
jgi:hypothetical protein